MRWTGKSFELLILPGKKTSRKEKQLMPIPTGTKRHQPKLPVTIKSCHQHTNTTKEQKQQSATGTHHEQKRGTQPKHTNKNKMHWHTIEFSHNTSTPSHTGFQPDPLKQLRTKLHNRSPTVKPTFNPSSRNRNLICNYPPPAPTPHRASRATDQHITTKQQTRANMQVSAGFQAIRREAKAP